jgi:hypothetical protein
MQLEIEDFVIPESSWSAGVATLNGPVAASDDGTGIGVLGSMSFAFDVQQNARERIALSSAVVSIRINPEADSDHAAVAIEAASIDFGGYQITNLFFDGELVSN